MKRTLSIVGAGRVGRTLGKRLRERGWRIGAVVTRSTATSRAAVRAIGAGTPLVWSGSAGLQLHDMRRNVERALGPVADGHLRSLLGGRSFSSDINSPQKGGFSP